MAGEPLLPIVALFALNAVDEFDSRTFELLGPEIARHFDIDVGTFGIITIFVVLLVPFVSVPVAMLSDRGRRMPIAVAGASVWAAFSIMTGLSPVLWFLIVARVGSGFGKVVNGPVHGSLIGDFYSPVARAKAFGLHALANPAGAAFASIVAGGLAEVFGFRAPFFVLALPTVAVLFLAARVPEPPRGRFERVEAPTAPPLRESVRTLWAIRSLRYQWIGGAWAAGSVFGVGILVPFFLEDEFNVGPGLRGVIIGIGTALSAVAVVAGTAAFQRQLDMRPSRALRMLSWTGFSAGVALVLCAVVPTLALFVILLWFITMVFAFVVPGLSTITALVAPPELRSTAFAVAGVVGLERARLFRRRFPDRKQQRAARRCRDGADLPARGRLLLQGGALSRRRHRSTPAYGRLATFLPRVRSMRFSIWPSPMRPWTEILELVQYCESTGWDGVYYADHFMPNTGTTESADGDTLECWSVIAGLAAAVPRLRLAPLVTSVTYRHPAVLANIAAAVDNISGGRLLLGIGAGWQDNEHLAYGIELGTIKERLDRFEEACAVITSLTREARTNFKGDYFQVTDAPNQPAPVQAKLPILIGGAGEKRTLKIAAQYADEWNSWTSPDVLAHKCGVLASTATPSAVTVSEIQVSTQALLFLSDDEEWLKTNARGQAAIVGTPTGSRRHHRRLQGRRRR